MRIVTARRISQVFFLLLFLWFCLVSNVGEKWWQLRGWPVNWFLQLDPLVALGTLLSTGTLYKGLIWAVVTVVLTILLGRFFCGWLCPFGTTQQFVGHLAGRDQSVARRAKRHRYHPAQKLKYILLFVLLGLSAWHLMVWLISPWEAVSAGISIAGTGLAIGLMAVPVLSGKKLRTRRSGLMWACFVLGLWMILGTLFHSPAFLDASLQVGLLDPISLMYRSVNLIFVPIADSGTHALAPVARYTAAGWIIGAVFLVALFLCIKVPRFYCRFVCPLGALFGILGRYSLWRIGKTKEECVACQRCESACEGACSPSGAIRIHECVLCLNCMVRCRDDLITYGTVRSEGGEISTPDLSRRGVTLCLVSGVAAVPMLRLGGTLGANWSPRLVRPPGALVEAAFLTRCIKCGQCMRVCPTNIIHPAGLEGGIEGIWTPVLNFRIGTSGCQVNCVACGHICPTSAIRPISLDEKHGRGDFQENGPIRLGTAFVDRGRCLPWAMDRPCIVCEENCPVSPKAIVTREVYSPVEGRGWTVRSVDKRQLRLGGPAMQPGAFGTGDYVFNRIGKAERKWVILDNGKETLVIAGEVRDGLPPPGAEIEIRVRLKQPFIVPDRCIGCGICEHECPVSGKRAIRVTAENETRDRDHALLARNA